MSLFNDNFETGTILTSENPAGKWPNKAEGTGCSFTIDSSTKHGGNYSAKSITTANGYASCNHNFSAQNNLYLRAYYNITSMPPSDNDFICFNELYKDSSTYSASAIIKKVSGQLYWGILVQENGNWTWLYEASPSNPSTGTWYCIEVRRDVSSGTVQLWIDGAQKVSQMISISQATNGIFSGTGNSLGFATTLYVDDLVLSTSYVGPISQPSGDNFTVTGDLTVQGNATINNTLTVDGMINSHASGSYPVASSNAGMILDCYTLTHQDGLGIQPGGIWLKYDNNFNIYYDNGSTILAAVALNTTGDMSIAGAYSSNVSSSAPAPHSNAGLKLDLWTAAHSDGIGMQNGGMWIKYGNLFDICYDSGSAMTGVLHLDTSGKMTVLGGVDPGAGVIIQRVADYVTISNRELPTESYPYKTYTDLGHGNILFQHTGTADVNHKFPPIVDGVHLGRYANIYEIMLQDPGDNTVYQPIIAMDRGLWVEKDIQTYGALFTSSDPGKGAGGGAILMGHGLTKDPNLPNDDPPRITLTESESPPNLPTTLGYFDTLYITKSTVPNYARRANIQNWQLGNLSVGSIRQSFTVGSGGVTIGQIVALDSNGNVVPASFYTNGTAVIGVAAQTQSQGGAVPVIIWGLARVAIDTEIFPGDRICASNVTAGKALAFNWHYHQMSVPSTPFSGNTATVNSGLVIGKALTHGTPSNPGYVDMIVSISS